MAFVVMDCGRMLLQEVCDAQLQIRKLAGEAVGIRKRSVDLFHELSS